MDRFTFAQLFGASASPLCAPGIIAEFGSGNGQGTIAKYVKLAYYDSTYLRIGEPLWLLDATAQGSSFADPYVPYLVSNNMQNTGPTGFITYYGGGSGPVSPTSLVGFYPGFTSTPSITNYATCASTPWVWALIRGPLKGARMITDTNSGDGLFLKPEAGVTTSFGGGLTVATAAADNIVGYQVGAKTDVGAAGTDYPNTINCYLSLSRWW